MNSSCLLNVCQIPVPAIRYQEDDDDVDDDADDDDDEPIQARCQRRVTPAYLKTLLREVFAKSIKKKHVKMEDVAEIVNKNDELFDMCSTYYGSKKHDFVLRKIYDLVRAMCK